MDMSTKMNITQLSSGLFYSTSFWLPPNMTWEDFKQFEGKEGYRKPSTQDFFVAWKLMPLLLIVKFIMEKYAIPSILAWAGIKEEPRQKPPAETTLEKAYLAWPRGKWSDREISGLVKQLDRSEEQVREWLMAKKKFALPTTSEMVSEGSWRCFVFSIIFVYGLYAHWSKEWFWDIKLCFKDFPQPVTEDVYWYFIMSLANYSAWNISQFYDVERKEPIVLMCHHIVTVVLLTGQWISGLHRVGLLVCLVHDLGDVLIELTRCLHYMGPAYKNHPLSIVLMNVISPTLWILTRNIILPFYLVPCIYYFSPFNLPRSFPLSCFHGFCNIRSFTFTSCHGLLMLVIGLCVLHIYWTQTMFQNLSRFYSRQKNVKSNAQSAQDHLRAENMKSEAPKKTELFDLINSDYA